MTFHYAHTKIRCCQSDFSSVRKTDFIQHKFLKVKTDSKNSLGTNLDAGILQVWLQLWDLLTDLHYDWHFLFDVFK